MRKPDGGSAFPQALTPETEFNGSEGMSLRDYFAGQALPEAIAHERSLRHAAIAPGEFRYEAKAIAHAAYVVADAMLAEREKP